MFGWIRCVVAAASVIGAIVLAAGASAAADAGSMPVDRSLYPYYPTLVQSSPSKLGFLPPEVCSGCHADKYREWRGSMHAIAFQDPIYQGELNKAVRVIGHDNARNCEGCHSPAGVVTGDIKGAGLDGLGPVARAGVSCDVCHSVSGVSHAKTPTGLPENASLILSPDRDTDKGTVRVKRGPFPPSPGCGAGFHECQESPLHLTAELCASCHQSTHYEAHTPLGSTYTEWKASPYAQKGVQCQDCHMVDIKTFQRVADRLERPKREEYRHFFNGANVLMYSLGEAAARRAGDEDLASAFRLQQTMAVERLQSAADLELNPVYRDGALAEVKVRVKNLRAGHSLPTHLTNIRQMWLEVTAKDASGKVVMKSGGIAPDGRLEADTRTFGSEGQDENFKPAVDPWAVKLLSRIDTVPARGYRDTYFGVPSPTGGAITISARLRYRQASQDLAQEILANEPKDIDLDKVYGLNEIPALPVVDMVVKEAVFETRR
jgi:cytochrome c554/c'-like protein